jgi:hypothetical protein
MLADVVRIWWRAHFTSGRQSPEFVEIEETPEKAAA